MSVRLILVGPPGAGKGTQAKLLCDSLGIPAISTGEIFRAHAAAGDELGKLADSYTSKGELVPDEVTNRMVTERLAEPVAAVVRDNPGLHDLIEWLGYLLEDLLEMRAACLSAGHGLDPEQFERA